jgi:hypothetical protein
MYPLGRWNATLPAKALQRSQAPRFQGGLPDGSFPPDPLYLQIVSILNGKHTQEIPLTDDEGVPGLLQAMWDARYDQNYYALDTLIRQTVPPPMVERPGFPDLMAGIEQYRKVLLHSALKRIRENINRMNFLPDGKGDYRLQVHPDPFNDRVRPPAIPNTFLQTEPPKPWRPRSI